MYRFLLLLFLSTNFLNLSAQDKMKDIQMVDDMQFDDPIMHYYHNDGESNDAIDYKKKSVLARYNPISLMFSALMLTYQNVISPQLSTGCIYELSCSNYAKHAIKEFGMLKGLPLSADRLLRCNRMAATDIHPMDVNPRNGKVADVPEKYRVKTKSKH